MTELLPYLGSALVIATGAAAAILLARHGLRIRKIKHDNVEMEFENSVPSLETKVVGFHLTRAMISITDTARQDTESLGLSPEDAIEFIHDEASRHPLLFEEAFTSLPLVFGRNVVLVSWDGSSTTIERVLSRKDAYPLNDAWSACLALYRQTTLLAYRTKGPEQLYTSTEARRAINVYRRLVARVNSFLKLLNAKGEAAPAIYEDLTPLLEEAEIALANDDVGTSVARLEAVLSTVHKLILQCAPQGPTLPQGVIETPAVLELSADGQLTALIVDDHKPTLVALEKLLREAGYAVATASTTIEAFRYLVEQNFNVVVTDMVMFSNRSDGREVALAAKTSSPETRVVVFTGYPEMSRIAELYEVGGVDHVMFKGSNVAELLEAIRIDEETSDT